MSNHRKTAKVTPEQVAAVAKVIRKSIGVGLVNNYERAAQNIIDALSELKDAAAAIRRLKDKA